MVQTKKKKEKKIIIKPLTGINRRREIRSRFFDQMGGLFSSFALISFYYYVFLVYIWDSVLWINTMFLFLLY